MERIKDLNKICNDCFPALNEIVIDTPSKENIMAYTVFASSLNLMILYGKVDNDYLEALDLVISSIKKLSNSDTLNKVVDFLGEESRALRKKSPVKGSYEKLSARLNIPDTSYKVKVGYKCLGGVEYPYLLKQRIISLQNLKDDQRYDEKYYTESFLPSLFCASGTQSLPDFIALTRAKPQEKLNRLITTLKPETHYLKVLEAYPKILQELTEYIVMRGGETISVPTDHSLSSLLAFTRVLLMVVNQLDESSIVRGIEEEMEKDHIFPEDNFQLLLSDNYQPLQRLEEKKGIKDASELLTSESEYLSPKIKLPFTAPLVSLGKLSTKKKIKKLLNLLQGEVKWIKTLMPYYQEIEKHFNRQATLLSELGKKIHHLIAPENKLTCINRCKLLVNTLVFANLTNPKRAGRLNKKYDFPSQGWYDKKEGLQMLPRLLELVNISYDI